MVAFWIAADNPKSRAKRAAKLVRIGQDRHTLCCSGPPEQRYTFTPRDNGTGSHQLPQFTAGREQWLPIRQGRPVNVVWSASVSDYRTVNHRGGSSAVGASASAMNAKRKESLP